VALKRNILHLVLHNEYSFATVSINLRPGGPSFAAKLKHSLFSCFTESV